MRVFSLFLLTAFLAVLPSASAQSPDDLPSAPSATLQQSKPKPQPPAPQPQPAAEAPAPAPAPPVSAPAVTPAATVTKPPAAPPPPTNTANNASANGNLDEDEPAITIRTHVDEVNVIFTVSDKHGRFVKDLNQSDFRVFDDRKPPKQIVGFSRQTNLPLRVGLLIDASNSIRDRFRFEQESAIEFLNQSIRPKSDLGFVIGFDTTAEVTADFTDDTEKLSQGVRLLRPGGGTAMYDAVYYACRDKLMKAPQTGPVRRAIILVSDGEDNQSRVTREEAIEMAQRAEVIIYAISTNTSGYKQRGDKVLERMAEATGGRAFFPFKVEDVANAFVEIQDELRSQYALAYKPADFVADGRFRTIEIETPSRKNMKVRARQGYYAPKQ
ncbi:MAG: VWA domain-containing protein [Terriglobales bacterium]